MPSASELRELLLASELAPSHVEVMDESDGCGSKFTAIIVSTQFDGQGLLDRQRSVNALLPMDEIHAFQMKTWTPEQHAAKTAKKA